MRQSVLVHEEHALDGASHADAFELVAHALEARRHRWVLLEQRIFGAECVVGQRVPVQTVLCYGCCAKQYQSPKALGSANTHKLIVRLMVIELATVLFGGVLSVVFPSISAELLLLVRGHPVVFAGCCCVVAIFVCVWCCANVHGVYI